MSKTNNLLQLNPRRIYEQNFVFRVLEDAGDERFGRDKDIDEVSLSFFSFL